MIQIERYQRNDGSVPFDDWFESLRDRQGRSHIAARLNRIRSSNFGDHVAVGEGVFELRVHSGPGYRIYFGKEGSAIVLLLCAGAKKSQVADIETAKGYWREWKARRK
jgi:putative addiction module killer protein